MHPHLHPGAMNEVCQVGGEGAVERARGVPRVARAADKGRVVRDNHELHVILLGAHDLVFQPLHVARMLRIARLHRKPRDATIVVDRPLDGRLAPVGDVRPERRADDPEGCRHVNGRPVEELDVAEGLAD
eukprot:363429-Chlamydomonas_euryale.AAC.8